MKSYGVDDALMGQYKQIDNCIQSISQNVLHLHGMALHFFWYTKYIPENGSV